MAAYHTGRHCIPTGRVKWSWSCCGLVKFVGRHAPQSTVGARGKPSHASAIYCGMHVNNASATTIEREGERGRVRKRSNEKTQNCESKSENDTDVNTCGGDI